MATIKNKKKRRRKKAGSIIFGVFLFLVALGAGAAFLMWGSTLMKTPPVSDPLAVMGSLPIPEETLKEADKKPSSLENIIVDYLNVFINSNPQYLDGTMDGDVRIENPIDNEYGIVVKYQVVTTGETVYMSGVIPPGYYIENAPLSKQLSQGKYPADAIIYAVNMQTSDAVAETSIRIFIDVLS